MGRFAETTAPRKRTLVAAVVAAVLALWAVALPQVAFAQVNYTIDELSCELDVQTDASVHVVERQILTFSGQNAGVVWYLHAPESGESVKVNEVRAAPVDDGGALTGEWTKLQMVDVNRVKQGAEPGDSAAASVRGANVQPWYSYSISDGMMRTYFPASRGTYLIEADYTISNRVGVYRDVAELYWRYANSSLPVDAHDVTLRIALPVPAGAQAVAGQDVVAWGHGPDAGTFVVGQDGSVTYHIDVVESGNYAEAHVVFPAWWISNAKAESRNVHTELRRAAAVAEEAEWVDASMRGATWDNKVRVLFLGVAVALIAAGLAAVARFGRTRRSRRALGRVACTLGIVALAENLFFREPLAFALLVGLAVVVAAVALWLPQEDVEVAAGAEVAADVGLAADIGCGEGIGDVGDVGDGEVAANGENVGDGEDVGQGEDIAGAADGVDGADGGVGGDGGEVPDGRGVDAADLRETGEERGEADDEQG